MTGCTSLGPNSGSFTWRSNKLSSGLQKAYSVPPSTANRLSPMIIQSADKYNVPPLLLAAVIRQESNYNSNARSPTGAVGLTQIIPSYWQQTCAGNLYDESTNIQCGAYILNHYYQTADSWFKATAYYNVGPTGYERSFWTRHKAKNMPDLLSIIKKFKKCSIKNLNKSPSMDGLFYAVNLFVK